jgi:phosphohistidine phosphatase
MARSLFLLRHAKSSWDDPTLADHERPLAGRGRQGSTLIAEYLRREEIGPALVLCSSAARSRETLERVSAGFLGEAEIRVEDELYAASADDLLARLRWVPAGVESVMLIGHAPALPELARRLAGRGAARERLLGKFPTAALATLSFEGGWQALAPGAAELVAFVKPRELEAEHRAG